MFVYSVRGLIVCSIYAGSNIECIYKLMGALHGELSEIATDFM